MNTNKCFALAIGCISVMAIGVLDSCKSDENSVASEPVYHSSFGLYVLEDDTVAYRYGDASSSFTSVERQINSALDNYAAGMLSDYSSNDNGNTLVSPVSATMLYAMMSNFVEEGTANSFLQNLGLDGYDKDDINSFCRKLNYQNVLNRNSVSEDSKFAMASNMWVQKETTIYKSFLSVAQSYGTQVQGVDFKNASGLASINRAILNQTNNKVEGIERSSWNDVTSIVTTSMDFKKQWKEELEADSYDSDFTNADGSVATCTMLSTICTLNYGSFGEFELVELPYADGDFSLYVVYPAESGFLNRSIEYLKKNGLEACIGKMGDMVVDLRIPKFKYEGVTQLNNAKAGKVSSIANMYASKLSKASPGGFRLNDVYQTYSIELNEKGTSVVVRTSTDPNPEHDPYIPGATPGEPDILPDLVSLQIEHPFAIFIRDNRLKFTAYACCIKTLDE